jgi:predicted transglutaminase-like cysteine proteinase
MWGRLMLAGCAVAMAGCVSGAPSLAVQRPATTSGDKAPYDDAQHAALFGSREVYSQSIWRFPQWTEMLARTAAGSQKAQHVCTSRSDADCVPPEWQALIARIQGLDLRQQIEIANDTLNRVRYVTTTQNWHRAMYWETAFEFLRFGGQCQDYAIAKYELLRTAGVSADLMRVVVLHDDASGLDHAVLAVFVDGTPMLLDNLRPDIVPANSVSYYHPYYSINENGWWYHLGGQAMTHIAAR